VGAAAFSRLLKWGFAPILVGGVPSGRKIVDGIWRGFGRCSNLGWNSRLAARRLFVIVQSN